GVAAYGTMPRPVQDDFTLEAWIKTRSSLPGTLFWQGLPIFHADVLGGNDDFGAAVLNDTFAFGMGLGPGGSDVAVQATTIVPTDQWIHVAATRAKSTGQAQVFVNGVLEQSVIFPQTNSLSAAPMLAVGGNIVDSHYYAGELDEVRIWNVVRTP